MQGKKFSGVGFMKDIVIIGAGGLGREVAQLIEDINADKKVWNLLGYIDETPEKQGTVINNNIVLGNFAWLEKNSNKKLCIVCAVGNPVDRYGLINRVSAYNIDFANLIHPGSKISKFSDLGTGCIVCSDSLISVNVKIGNHVLINPACGIGHDTVIGDYSSLYWDVILSGNVCVREGCEIGSKAVVIPKTTVGKWSILGAGAVAVDDIPDFCTAVGVPAKPIKFKTSEILYHKT